MTCLPHPSPGTQFYSPPSLPKGNHYLEFDIYHPYAYFNMYTAYMLSVFPIYSIDLHLLSFTQALYCVSTSTPCFFYLTFCFYFICFP